MAIRYMKLCHTREELARLPQGPKLVLATLPSLQAGMARDLFMEWAPDPNNLILFTQQAEVRPPPPRIRYMRSTLLLTCCTDMNLTSNLFTPLSCHEQVCCFSAVSFSCHKGAGLSCGLHTSNRVI